MKRTNWGVIRKSVIRDIVYKGVAIDQVAKRYGVTCTCITRRLKAWGVHLPLHLCGFPRRTDWFLKKGRLGENLPKLLKDYNRSDLAALYAVHTVAELSRILNVSRYHVKNALDYHCISTIRKEVFDACPGDKARIVS